ncbi:hypothetical protein HK104_007561 [Borealophlyctis nickersoniae]|nr:hypothetical protein HK104_007561 [Borealophlyctis nickersoniae]
MKQWMENYVQDDDTDRQTLALIKTFATRVMNEPMAFASQQLVRLVEKREVSGGSLRKIVPTSRECPPAILPRNMKRIRFFELDATEVARQLTIMESREYNKVLPVEFLKKAWSDKDNPVAVNVKTMIGISNQVTGWVASSIVSERDIKKRAQLIKQFILIADRCQSLNNFNTLMSILAGLNSAPIHRLKRTWELLSAKTQGVLEGLRRTMNPTKNFATYREMLHSANPPCVPFLGFYLTDLTFIEDGNPDEIRVNPNGTVANSSQPEDPNVTPIKLINFSKRMKTAEVIREVQQYQNVPYALTPVPELQQFLKGSFMATMDDANLYDLSLELEPREREDEKITRLLHESGFL